jgi:hypothetical protein
LVAGLCLHAPFFDITVQKSYSVLCCAVLLWHFVSQAAYDKLLFREALKVAGYDLANARDVYR